MHKLTSLVGAVLAISMLFGVVAFAPGWQPVPYALASRR